MRCQSCGGELGRDCFNTQECAEITADMARQASGEEINAEMLSVLQALVRAGGIWPDLYPRVEAAIAKATSPASPAQDGKGS